MCKIAINYDDKKRDLAKRYLSDHGLNMTDAISIFLDAVVMDKGMPNATALENAEDIRMATKAVIKDAKKGAVPLEKVMADFGL